MYIPKDFEETNLAVLHALIRSKPLATWVTMGSGELIANHIPFLLDESRGDCGTLMGHVARANPVWQLFSTQVASVVIFQGSQAYISPSWYPSKGDYGKAVPTWNYAVVHAHGFLQAIHDKEWLLKFVTQLSDVHEASQEIPWSTRDAPADYIDSLLGAIVGIEIPINKILGKWKISQNRSQADQLGAAKGLSAYADSDSRDMADLINQHVSSVDRS